MRRHPIERGLAAKRQSILGAVDKSAPRTAEAARAIWSFVMVGDPAPPLDHRRNASGAD